MVKENFDLMVTLEERSWVTVKIFRDHPDGDHEYILKLHVSVRSRCHDVSLCIKWGGEKKSFSHVGLSYCDTPHPCAAPSRMKQMLRIIICKYTFPQACFQIIAAIFNAAVDVSEPSSKAAAGAAECR